MVDRDSVVLNRPQYQEGVPSSVTGVELKAVKKATRSAGTRRTYAIEESLAAAIGANLLVN
jgi:rod shape-determining protein MreB and related proteins